MRPALPTRRAPSGWRFLTPEVERLGPALAAALAPYADARRSSADEAARLDRLVVEGNDAAWFAELRALRELAEHASAGGAPPALVHRLADILRDQYRLAPSVHEPTALDDDEEAALDRLVARTARHEEPA